MLTPEELIVLQDMLYSASERVYRLANLAPSGQWLARYQPLHADVARLFLQAARELIARLDHSAEAPAA